MADPDDLYWSYAEGYARGRMGLADLVKPPEEALAAAAFLLGLQDGRAEARPRAIAAIRADARRFAA
jgi:hypothetical protein